MNLATIEVSIYDRLNLGPNPDQNIQRGIRRFVNDTLREVLTAKWASRLRRQLLTFSTTGVSPFVTLPASATHVYIVTDRTNNNLLEEISVEQLRYNDPGLKSSSAIPYAYAIYNFAAPVTQDPITSNVSLTLVSDSVSDGSGTSANVEGVTSDGQYYKGSVLLNGTTPVTITAPAAWLEITKFYLSVPAQGHVSLKDSGANVLAQISPGRSYARYTRLHLYPNCTAVLTLTADVELHIEDMSVGGDEPILPEDFHDALIFGGLEKEYLRRRQLDLAGTFTTLKRQRIAQLQSFLARQTGTPFNQSRPRRFSQLGPNFPSGS